MDRLNSIEVEHGKAEVLPKLAYTSNIPTPKYQVHLPKPSGIGSVFISASSTPNQLVILILLAVSM